MNPSNSDRPEKPTRSLPPTPDEHDSPVETNNSPRSAVAASSPSQQDRNNPLRTRTTTTTTPNLIITEETPEPGPSSVAEAIILETVTGLINATSPPPVLLGPVSPTVLSPSFSRQHSPTPSLQDILRDERTFPDGRYPRRARTMDGHSAPAIDNGITSEQRNGTRRSVTVGEVGPQRPSPVQAPEVSRSATRWDSNVNVPMSSAHLPSVQMPVPNTTLGMGMGNPEIGAQALRSRRSFNNMSYDWNIPHTISGHPNTAQNGQVNGHANDQTNDQENGEANDHTRSHIIQRFRFRRGSHIESETTHTSMIPVRPIALIKHHEAQGSHIGNCNSLMRRPSRDVCDLRSNMHGRRDMNV